jgi:protein-disulfide isomerase
MRATPARQGGFGAGFVGGIAGTALTAAVLVFAAPTMLSTKIVRQGLLADPRILTETVEALRDAQYAPTLAANRAVIETPFASSWKGAAKPQVTLVEFYDYACPYCKASNPTVERLLKEDKGLRVVFKELPILGPDSVTAARLSLEASKLGRFAQFHDALWDTGRPAPDTNAKAAATAGINAAPNGDPEVDAELQRNMKLAGELGATGTPLFVVGDRVMNGAVGYDTLREAIAKARQRS